MPSEFAPPGGKPRVTKKQIQQIQENYQKAEELKQDLSAEEEAEKQDIDQVFEAAFDNAFVEVKSVWVYVGRFQPLHIGHKTIIESMWRENEHNYFFVWVGWQREQNPFDFDIVESFFEPYKSDLNSIIWVQDVQSDQEWIKNIFSHIQLWSNIWKIIVYGWDMLNDSSVQAFKSYAQEFSKLPIEYREIDRTAVWVSMWDQLIPISGTLCRKAIENHDFAFLRQAVPAHVFTIIETVLWKK